MTGPRFVDEVSWLWPHNVAVDDYVTALAAQLPGPRRARTAALEEVRDGLHEAITARAATGVSPALATKSALAELGDPTTVARAFAPELATIQARRVLFAFLITGPLVGGWWLVLLAPDIWPPSPQAWWAAIPVLPLVAVAIAAAVAILATTGSFIRWLPESNPLRALHVARGVGIGCLVVDLTVIGIFAARSSTTHWQPALPLLAGAFAASLIRITGTLLAIIRCGGTIGNLRRSGQR